MSFVLAFIGLPLVLVLPGLCTLAALAPLRRLDWPERVFLVVAVSLLVAGWLGVLLAWIGIFFLWLLLGLLALYSAGMGLLAWRRGNWRWPRPDSPSGPAWQLAVLVALTALFGLLAMRPFELILGPRDAAIYPAMGVQIARHGSILIHDPLLPEMAANTPTADPRRLWNQFFPPQVEGRFYYEWARMPGMFISSFEEGTIVPQFYPLYPTWLATGFSLLGLQGGLLVTPLLSLLGGLGVFLVARRLFGGPPALLAYGFLVLNTLQVWFARYSTAEGGTQLLLFLGVYGLVRLEENREANGEPFWGLLAGLAIGMVGLVRVEFIFPWLLLLPYLAVLIVAHRVRRGHQALLAVLGVLGLETLLLFLTLTRAYTINSYYHRLMDFATTAWLVYPLLTPNLQEWFRGRTVHMQQIGRLGIELIVLGWTTWTLLWLRRARWAVERMGGWLYKRGRLLLLAGAALFMLLFLAFYLVFPRVITPTALLHPWANRLTWQGYIGAPVPESSNSDVIRTGLNIVRIGWYFSPLGMLLAAVGITVMIGRESSRRTWYLLLLGLFYFFFFSYETFGVAHHVYIMRRYIPGAVPFLCIAMAYALAWLWQSRRLRQAGRWLAAGLAVVEVAFLAYTGLPFFRHTEYKDAIAQVGALAERFQPQDVLLLLGGERDAPYTIATPLQYLFDRQALVVIADPPRTALIESWIQRWQAEGRAVYLLLGNDGGRLYLPHFSLRQRDKFELAVPEFEQLMTQKPHNSYILHQPFGIYVPEPWTEPGSSFGALPVEIDLGSGGYSYQDSGFYSDETADDGTTYCWTREGGGVLRIPWPATNQEVTITVRLAGGKRPDALGPAQVELRAGLGPDQPEPRVEERLIASWTLEEGFTTHAVSLRSGDVSPDASGTLFLTLSAPTWKQSKYGLGNDPRPLGVQVDWVKVEVK